MNILNSRELLLFLANNNPKVVDITTVDGAIMLTINVHERAAAPVVEHAAREIKDFDPAAAIRMRMPNDGAARSLKVTAKGPGHRCDQCGDIDANWVFRH